uniref:Uncharacterized protein n=1 Tax=Syphacia muris TaxID=451379 RepID=A0A0N5ARK8_9BILA
MNMLMDLNDRIDNNNNNKSLAHCQTVGAQAQAQASTLMFSPNSVHEHSRQLYTIIQRRYHRLQSRIND